MQGYLREGRRYVTIAVGCTGGKHRVGGHGRGAVAGWLSGGDVATFSCTATWGGSEPPRRSWRWAAATAWPPRSPPCGSSPTTSPRSSRSPTTAAPRPAARGVRRPAAGRPADGPGRAVRRQRVGHTWRDVLQHRFAGAGPLGGHALGNLLIVALWELLGDTVGGPGPRRPAARRPGPGAAHGGRAAADRGQRARRRPRPARRGRPRVRGQVAGRRPPRAGCSACAWTRRTPGLPGDRRGHPRRGLGRPGPGLLVHLGDAAPARPGGARGPAWPARARKMLTLNLVMHTGETAGFSAENHLEVLAAHAARAAPGRGARRPRASSTTTAVLRNVAAGLGRRAGRRAGRRDTASPATTTRCAWRRPTATSSAEDRSRRTGPGPRQGRGLRRSGRMTAMAMTAKVKDELSSLEVTKPCCRKAEVSATLRFAGGLHIVGGRIVVEAELDTGAGRAPAAQGDLRGLRPLQRRDGAWPRAACAGAAATSSAWSRTARRWPARPA